MAEGKGQAEGIGGYSMSVNLRVTGLHPQLAEAFSIIQNEFRARKLNVGLHSGVRSHAEQQRLWMLGREIINSDGKTELNPMGNIITNAQAFNSFHEFGLAGDIVPKNEVGQWTWNWSDENWEQLGSFGEKLGLVWGGRWKFKDLPHFQIKTNLAISEIKKIFFSEGIDKLWSSM